MVKVFSEFLEENNNAPKIIGVKETVEVKQIGHMKAKFDTGNSAMTALIVDEYEENGKTVKFSMFDKTFEFPIVGYKKILHASTLQSRPYIYLDIVFNGKLYPNEKVNLKINTVHNLNVHARLLVCKDFLKRINVLIDPSDTFKITKKVRWKSKKSKKTKKKINEGVYDFYTFKSVNESELSDEDLCKFKLSNEDKETLIQLDKRYGTLASLFRQEYRAKNVLNTEEELEKFISARSQGKKYFPKLKLESVDIDVDIEEEASELLNGFENFNSYISKFYIEKLRGFIHSIKKSKELEELSDDEEYEKPSDNVRRSGSFPTDDEYQHAMKTIIANPYISVSSDERTIDAKTAAKQLQKHVDSLGYGFNVKLVDNMLPRVNVTPDGVVRVNSKVYFSNDDIEGLKQHEIEGHVGRRYYGYKSGLHLFVFGLIESNTYDEGLAIWNSINNVKTPKPNILFNIALKTIITYNLYKKDFCELFDFIKEIQPTLSDEIIFKSIIRMKRGVKDCQLYGGALESGYFGGYNFVRQMDDDGRDDILQYNIGPSHLADLESIKKFLLINKFDELKIPSVNNVSESLGAPIVIATDSSIKKIVHDAINKYGASADLTFIDVSNVTDFDSLFYGVDFTGDISTWNTSSVVTMFAMFKSSTFNGDISMWQTSNVTDMSYMFEDTVFNKDISSWDVHNVVYMTGMFKNSKFNNDISLWNLESCKFTNYMFYNSIFNQDISHWCIDTVKHVSYMFEKSVFNNDISHWNTVQFKSIRNMFKDSKFNQDISMWVISDDCDTTDVFMCCDIEYEYTPKL